MATLGNDPAKEAENTETTNVLGPSGAPQAPAGGSEPAGGSNPTQPSPMAQAAPKAPSGAKSGGASSGMFQNIKKYAAANKPQAATMAGAVTKNVGNQAANIGKSVERQQKAFQSSLQQQQGKIQEAKDFTSGIVQNITGGGQQQAPAQEGQPAQAEFSGPSAQDFTKFRENLTGGAQQFGEVSDLNIAKQQQQTNNLQRMASGAETGQGRRELLKNTFAKQNPYTAGMQGLDDLIVSSDKDARTQLAQGTQDIVSKQKRSIDDTRTQAMKDLSGYDRDRSGFSQDLKDQLQAGSTQFTDRAEDSAKANRVERQALAAELGVTEEEAGQYMDEQFTGRGRNSLYDAYKAIGGGQGRRNTASQKMLPEMKEVRSGWDGEIKMVPTGKMLENKDYDPEASDYLMGSGRTGSLGSKTYAGDVGSFRTGGRRSSQRFGRPTGVYSNKFSEADMELLGMEKGDLNFDISKNGYVNSGGKKGFFSDSKHWSNYSTGRMKNELDRLTSSVEDKTGRDAMLASLARGGMESTGELGSKYDDLVAGKDINAQSSASGDTISRYNSLQNLMQGMDIGDRSLQAGSSAIGESKENQEALAKMRADILKRIGKGEAQ